MVNYPNNISVFDLKHWLESEDEKPIIIDVREDVELETALFPYSYIHIPMSKVSLDYVSSKLKRFKNKELVIMCHMGVRSYHFGNFLLENQFIDHVWNLENGIDGWSKYIDSNVPRY